MAQKHRMRNLLLLAVVVGAGVIPASASAHGFATHFFAPAVRYNGEWVRSKPRLITVPQRGYVIRYAVNYWEGYTHSFAAAEATAFVNGNSFPVRLTFTGPRRIPVTDGTWWQFTRLTVNNFHHSYPDTGYDRLMR